MPGLLCFCTQELYLEGFRPKARDCLLSWFTTAFPKPVRSCVSEEEELIWDLGGVPALGRSRLPDGQLFAAARHGLWRRADRYFGALRCAGLEATESQNSRGWKGPLWVI